MAFEILDPGKCEWKQGGVEALQAARTVGGMRHGDMDSWPCRCEGTEEALLSLTEHGDKAARVQGGPDPKELDGWTVAPVERGWAPCRWKEHCMVAGGHTHLHHLRPPA